MDTDLTVDTDLLTMPNTNWVCDCAHCSSGRLVHWRCDGCGGGPFRFSHADPAGTPMKTPYGQRQYNNTRGLVAGIRRWCSAKCAITEEKVYLLDQLDKAQARRDLTTVRVITGRLHELASNVPPQIPSLTEKLQRVDDRAKSLVLEGAEVDVDGKPMEG